MLDYEIHIQIPVKIVRFDVKQVRLTFSNLFTKEIILVYLWLCKKFDCI